MKKITTIVSLIGFVFGTTPTMAQQGLASDDIEIEVHIIGMEVDASTQAQLQQMATVAGGIYHNSNDPAALTGALAAATGVGINGTGLFLTAEKEPNNSFGTANPIMPSGAISGRIAPEDDVDWYEIIAPKQGELRIATTAVPPELDIVFRVWTRNKDVLAGWYRPARVGGETIGVIDLPERGLYRLEVRDGNDDAFADSDYALSLTFKPTPDTKEPNNAFADAGLLSLPMTGTLLASILPEDDADWYRITVDHQGELAIDLTNVPSELDLNYRVWNANKDVIDNWEGPPRVGGDTIGITDLPGPGDYFIELRDGNDDARSIEPYSLSARFSATADTDEPNNRFDQATPIATDASIEAAILPEDDVDWYRVTVDHQGELEVTLTHVPPEIDIHYRVWNANKDVIAGWYRPGTRGANLVGITDLPAQGDYFIEVRDGNDDARSPMAYHMATSFTPTPDTGEPNNHFGEAQTIKLDTPLLAAILPENDADWYALDLSQQGALTVSVTASPPGLDIVYRVWSSNKEAMTGWYAPLRQGGDTVHVVDIPSPGRWFLEVRDGNDDARAVQPYTLALGFVPTADGSEPNNRFGDATPMQIGSRLSANILPQRDEDWYAVSVSEQGALTVEITEVDAALDVVFRAWNTEKDAMTGWYSPLRHGGTTTGTVDIDRPGTYLLQVADGNHDERSEAPYELTTRFDATGDLSEPSTSPDSAADLGFGQPMEAAIFPEDDHDWFAVRADRGGVMHVAITNVAPELDLVLRVRDESGSVISGWHAPLRAGGKTSAEVKLPSAGRYVIEVADGNDDARSTKRYTITAELANPAK